MSEQLKNNFKEPEVAESLERKIFKIILIFGITVSLINITVNYFVGFSWAINLKWILMVLLSAGLLRSVKNDFWEFYFLKLSYFIFVIFVFLPFSWLQSGGTANNGLSYIFLIMIALTFLFKKDKTRNLLHLSLIGVFIILYLLEYFYPNFLIEHSPQLQFVDKLIQTPIILTASYLLLLKFASAYNQEKSKLGLSTKKLRLANQKLKSLANRDPLTKQFNRRAFDREIRNIFKEQLHLKQAISLVLFDIDNFKDINDNYGHDIGDQVLIKLTEELERTMPQDTLISRWGGDEFAVICYRDEKRSQEILDKYYQNIAELAKKMDIPITVSAGLSRLKKDDRVNQLFKRVDDILYKSKEAGKDRYTVA